MQYFIDLVNDLKKDIFAPVYLFYGPESYLRREAGRRIRDSFLSGGPDDFNFTTLDADVTSTREILSLALMTPLFSGRRLLIVNNLKAFARKKNSGDSPGEEADTSGGDDAAILKYLAAVNPSTCLILDAGETVDKRKRIFKELAKTGKVIEFTLLKTGDLCAWLEKQARLTGKSLAPGVAVEIIARSGNSLQSLSPEISKLISYVGDNRFITLKDVIAATPPSPEEDVFAVVDAIGERSAPRAIAGINRLVARKHPPPAILAMVARQIRLILRAGEALRSGILPGELAPRLGIHPFVAKKMASQQKNFKRDQLVKVLFVLHSLDQAVKSGRQEFLPGMETLILNICRKK